MQKNTIIALVIFGLFALAVILGIVLGKNSETEVDASLPTLMEIGSVSCEPCQMLKPIIDGLKDEYQGRVNVVVYDSWNTQVGAQKASEYDVTSIPTLIYLDKDGNELYRMVGYQEYSTIKSRFNALGWN